MTTTLPPGFAEGIDGRPVEISRWCPSCRQLVLFNDTTLACSWCDTPTIPAADAAAATDRKETPVTMTAVKCRIDGCDQEAAARTGVYANLCDTHKQQRRDELANGHRGGQNGENTLAHLVKQLAGPARRLDKATARMAAIATPESSRAELNEAIRRVEGAPTVENLARLEQATRRLRERQPKRDKARAELDAAANVFREGLAELAKRSKVV